MTISSILTKLTSSRAAVDKEGRFSAEVTLILNDLVREINAGFTQANTDIDAAESGGDLKTFGISASFVWWSDSSGTFPASDPTRDLVVVFNEDGNQVATRTLRGTLSSSAGTIAATAVSTTGEATTISTVNDGTDSVRVDVTHTASGAIASASWAATDLSAAGGSPASGGAK